MALSLDLRTLVDSVLTEFSPIGDKNVYSRIVTRTGGDALLNIGMTVTETDALLSPQPVYSRLDISRNSIPNSDINIVGSNVTSIGDYEFVISLNSISKAVLLDKDTMLVLKPVDTTDTTEEVLRLVGYDSIGVKGTDVLFTGYYRSVKRG